MSGDVGRTTAEAAAAKGGILAGVDVAFAIGFGQVAEFSVVLIVAPAVAGEQRAQRVMKAIIPLRVHSDAAKFDGAEQARIVAIGLREQVNGAVEAFAEFMDGAGELLQEGLSRF